MGPQSDSVPLSQNQDCENMGAKRVLVVTDKRLVKMKPTLTVLQALDERGVKYDVYDDVRVEPTDERWETQYK